MTESHNSRPVLGPDLACSKSLEARTGGTNSLELRIMYQNSQMYPLCHWLKVKAAKLKRLRHWKLTQPIALLLYLSLGCPSQWQQGTKTPLLVPWAGWLLTRARPDRGDETWFQRRPSWQQAVLGLLPQLSRTHRELLSPEYHQEARFFVVEKSGFVEHIWGWGRWRQLPSVIQWTQGRAEMEILRLFFF